MPSSIKIESSISSHRGSVLEVNNEKFYLNGKYKDLTNEKHYFNKNDKHELNQSVYAIVTPYIEGDLSQSASQIVIDGITKFHLYIEDNISDSLEEKKQKLIDILFDVDKRIKELRKEDETAGAYLLGAFTLGHKLITFSVGVNRLLALREDKDILTLIDSSEETSKDNNYLGGLSTEPAIKVSKHIDLKKGDKFILLNKGIGRSLDNESIKSIIDSNEDLNEITKQIIKYSIENGSKENLASLLISVERLTESDEKETQEKVISNLDKNKNNDLFDNIDNKKYLNKEDDKDENSNNEKDENGEILGKKYEKNDIKKNDEKKTVDKRIDKSLDFDESKINEEIFKQRFEESSFLFNNKKNVKEKLQRDRKEKKEKAKKLFPFNKKEKTKKEDVKDSFSKDENKTNKKENKTMEKNNSEFNNKKDEFNEDRAPIAYILNQLTPFKFMLLAFILVGVVSLTFIIGNFFNPNEDSEEEVLIVEENEEKEEDEDLIEDEEESEEEDQDEDLIEEEEEEEEEEEYQEYTVESGDSLYRISNKFYGDPEKYNLIMNYNNLSSSNLTVGQVLKIPNEGVEVSDNQASNQNQGSNENQSSGSSSSNSGGNESSGYELYTVQSGDTLFSISRKFYNGDSSKHSLIAEFNNIEGDSLYVGQEIKIPKTND